MAMRRKIASDLKDQLSQKHESIQSNKMENLKKLFKYLALLPIYIFCSPLPKSKNIWIYSAWGGLAFCDNPKYQYIYNQENERKTHVWITKSRTLNKELKERGINSHYHLSLKGIYFQAFASAAFFSHHHNHDFFGPLITRKTKKIQLWHGSPIKKILYDDIFYRLESDTPAAKFSKILFPWTKNNFDLISAASEEVAKILSSAFRSDKVRVTGYPRNDQLVNPLPPYPSAPTRIIYMPTFRGRNGTIESSRLAANLFKNSKFSIKDIDSFLTKNNTKLSLRLHPSNIPDAEFASSIKATHSIDFNNSEDIYKELTSYDALITDYSSIAFDFMLTGRPVIHAPFDIDEYLAESRELYFDFQELCLTPEVNKWPDIMEILSNLKSLELNSKYKSKYRSILNRFNSNLSHDSAKQILALTKSLAKQHNQQ